MSGVVIFTCGISLVSKSELFSRLQSVTGDGGGFDTINKIYNNIVAF